MSEIVMTGKTVEEALELACRELGVTRDEVTYQIIEMPQKVLFWSKPAKITVRVKEEEFSLSDLFKDYGSDDGRKNGNAEKGSREQKNQKNKNQKNKNQKATAEPRAQEQAAEPEKKEEKKDKPAGEQETAKEPGNGKNKKKKNKNRGNGKKEENKAKENKPEETAARENEIPMPEDDGPEEVLEPVEEKDLPARAVYALAYLKEIAAVMGLKDITYSFAKTERGIRILLNGKDAPVLIGRRGDTMDALQYLCTVASSREDGEYCRITLDIEGYRARREESLRELAAKMAAKVKKNRRSQTLEPMNPYERRIVHAAVQKIDGVDSHSIGSEPYRKVIITLEGASQDRKNRSREGRKSDGEGRRDRQQSST
ncbi:MAG: Jag N-terminal domain-containing protein, partial [Oscillospiraceae bacterium]|nr:Jag N-terminal domain-containing protein [Oscillospiraceae bacterium]